MPAHPFASLQVAGRRLAAWAAAAPSRSAVATATRTFASTPAWVRSEYLQATLSARVYDVADETPLQRASHMSKRLGHDIFLKREDLQPVFSFKIRGAYNHMAHLSAEQRSAGVVACSAGNHAQGVALAAGELGVDAKIVMPTGTPNIKVQSVRNYGGNVVLHGDSFDDAQAHANELVREEGRTLVHPFDDPLVIAGQATVGMEILRERNGKPLDAIFVCCGGGGLLAGIASYVKAVRPQVRVIGVEAADAAGMTESLRQDRVVTLESVGLFADGAAVRRIGAETFRLCREHVDEMITVTTEEICAAVKTGFNNTRSVMEPAGALAIAGMEKYCQRHAAAGVSTSQSLVAVTSGANMDFDRLRFVAERADATETFISVLIPERPGSFRDLYGCIFPRNVTSFSYRYADDNDAFIFMSFQSSSAEDTTRVLSDLSTAGYVVNDLSGNEMAISHARFLAGGRSPNLHHELLYRFEFPERPGALRAFLDKLSSDWSVSLFHYRNHGHDIGRVLVGVQVQDTERESWHNFLDDLGYEFADETSNPVYRQFLR